MEEISYNWALSGPNISGGNNVCKGFGGRRDLGVLEKRKRSVLGEDEDGREGFAVRCSL